MANKDLTKFDGTIAKHLIQHKDEIWACGDNVEAMRKVVLKLLDEPTLKDKMAVLNAKQILGKSHPNLFISSLMTYMTGDKVSDYDFR